MLEVTYKRSRRNAQNLSSVFCRVAVNYIMNTVIYKQIQSFWKKEILCVYFILSFPILVGLFYILLQKNTKKMSNSKMKKNFSLFARLNSLSTKPKNVRLKTDIRDNCDIWVFICIFFFSLTLSLSSQTTSDWSPWVTAKANDIANNNNNNK